MGSKLKKKLQHCDVSTLYLVLIRVVLDLIVVALVNASEILILRGSMSICSMKNVSIALLIKILFAIRP